MGPFNSLVWPPIASFSIEHWMKKKLLPWHILANRLLSSGLHSTELFSSREVKPSWCRTLHCLLLTPRWKHRKLNGTQDANPLLPHPPTQGPLPRYLYLFIGISFEWIDIFLSQRPLSPERQWVPLPGMWREVYTIPLYYKYLHSLYDGLNLHFYRKTLTFNR